MTEEKPFVPFRPNPRDFTGFPMPRTVSAGLRLELSRSRIVNGQEAEFDEWMQKLNDRCDESLAAIPAERAVFEATFRHTEGATAPPGSTTSASSVRMAAAVTKLIR